MPATEHVDADKVLDVWRAIRALPKRQQEAIVLRFVFDLQVKEVAEVMGCREETAKAHLARGREALRRSIGRGEEG